jgi:hypothetical protein
MSYEHGVIPCEAEQIYHPQKRIEDELYAALP